MNRVPTLHILKLVLKILEIVSYGIIPLATYYLLKSPPVTGYEPSIYTSLSEIFWIIISIGITSSILVIFFSAFFQRYNHWKYGLISLILLYCCVFYIPYYRGYLLYGRGGDDILVHLGDIKAIIYTGYIANNNIYPVVHLIGSEIKLIGELSLRSVVNIISLLFLVIYFLSLPLVIRGSPEMSRNTVEQLGLFILSFGGFLFFSELHNRLHPSILSFFVVPLFLYLFRSAYTSQDTRYILILSVFSLLFVFFHPMTSFLIIIMLGVFAIFESSCCTAREKTLLRFYIMTTILLSVPLMLWILSKYPGVKLFRAVITALIYSETTYNPPGEGYISLINVAGLSLFQIGRIIINRYGHVIIYYVLSFIFAIITIIDTINKITNKPGNKIKTSNTSFYHLQLLYSIQFFIGVLLSIIFMFGEYLVESNPLRVSRYGIVMASIFLGISFYRVYVITQYNHKKRIIMTMVVVALFFTVSLLSLLSLFDDPRTIEPNAHLTYMEWSGITSFFEHRYLEIPAALAGLNLYKYEDCYFSTYYSPRNREHFLTGGIPSHFGYLDNKTLKDVFNKSPLYVITTEFNKYSHLVFPEKVRPKVRQYLNEDFRKLHVDSTVNKIYENGGFEVWIIA